MRSAIAFIALSLCSSAAVAQAPELVAVWPPAGVRGQSVQAVIQGKNLAKFTSVLVGGAGVKVIAGAPAADGNSLPVTIETAPGAAPGAREVRVMTPTGLSAPGYVWVGNVSVQVEAEPNNQPAEAMKIAKLPTALYGKCDGGEDVDYYSFEANAGEAVVFDIAAIRLFSNMDPFLELQDSQGRILDMGMEGYDRDPRIIHTFKASGTYRLLVRDTQYRGGGGYLYLVTLGKLPVITSTSPAGGRRGQTLSVAVSGVNLGDLKTLQVPLPTDMPVNQGLPLFPETPNGPSLPIYVAGDDMPQMDAVSAPTSARAQRLPGVPITVNGAFSDKRESQFFAFVAAQGQPVRVLVSARSFGSRAHPLIRITDTAGKELLNTEDQIGRDPRVTFNPPASGDYRLELIAVDPNGSPQHTYRLTLAPAESRGFSLAVGGDVIAIGKGQTVGLGINLNRMGGFNGPIEVTVEGLPAGVVAAPHLFTEGETAGTLTLTSTADAAVAPGLLSVLATGSIDGKTSVTVQAQVNATLPRPGEGQPMQRPVGFQAAYGTLDVPLFTLTPEMQQLTLARGQSVSIKIKAGRKAGDNNANPAIGLEALNLPAGVTAELPAIAEKAVEGTIKLTAAAGAVLGRRTILLRGKIGEANLAFAPGIQLVVK